MALTPRQRWEVNNIIASVEMDTVPLSEEAKRELELIVAGELDVEVAISRLVAKATGNEQ